MRNIKKFPWYTALLISFASFTNLYYASYASALMSEGMYLFLSVAVLYMAEKMSRGTASDGAQHLNDAVRLALLIFLSACVFHTRIIGITLIAAVLLKLLLDRKFKPAMIYGLCTVCLTIVPWQLFQMIAQSANADILGGGDSFLFEYFDYERVFQDLAIFNVSSTEGFVQQAVGNIKMLSFRIYESLFPMLAHALLLVPASKNLPAAIKKTIEFMQFFLPIGLAAALCIPVFSAVRKRVFSVTGLYVALYLCVVIVWGFSPQITRFICVLMPFLWIAVLAQVGPVQPSGIPAKKRSLLALGFWLCLPVAALPANMQALQGLHAMRDRHILTGDTSVDLWGEYTSTIASLKTGTSPQAVIGAKHDKIFYLYTGRKAFPAAYPDTYFDRNKVLSALLDVIHKNHIYVLVMEPEVKNYAVQYPFNRAVADIIQQHPQQTKRVYMAPAGKISVYLYNPQQDSGPATGREQ